MTISSHSVFQAAVMGQRMQSTTRISPDWQPCITDSDSSSSETPAVEKVVHHVHSQPAEVEVDVEQPPALAEGT